MSRVREILLIWNFRYKNWCYRKLLITLKMFGNWTQSSYKMNVCVVSYFEPLGLRCEMIVIPLGLV